MDSPFGIRRYRRKPSINITSLIDVMFLLLIFLMVSTTFRQQLGIDVDLPEAGTASAQEMRPHEIVVTRNGEYYFGEQRVDEAGLREAIVKALESEPEASLVLRADEQADFGKVIRAVDIARDVGGTRFIIPTRHPENTKP